MSLIATLVIYNKYQCVLNYHIFSVLAHVQNIIEAIFMAEKKHILLYLVFIQHSGTIIMTYLAC